MCVSNVFCNDELMASNKQRIIIKIKYLQMNMLKDQTASVCFPKVYAYKLWKLFDHH